MYIYTCTYVDLCIFFANNHASWQFKQNGKALFEVQWRVRILLKLKNFVILFLDTWGRAVCANTTETRCQGSAELMCTKSKTQTLPKRTMVTSVRLLIGSSVYKTMQTIKRIHYWKVWGIQSYFMHKLTTSWSRSDITHLLMNMQIAISMLRY